MNDKELREAIKKLIPRTMCTGDCDGNGTYTEEDSDGQPYPSQCEYCYVVRFPAIDALITLFREQEAKHQEIYSWLLGENGIFPISEAGRRYNWRDELKKRISELTKKG